MGLPNFQYYYWACNVRALSFWNQTLDSNDQPAWVQMEQSSCQPSSAGALLFSPMPIALAYTKKNPVVKHSLRIWTKIRQHFGWQTNSLLAPLCANHHFQPSLSDDAFQLWNRNGIKRLKNLYIDGMFPSFELLKKKFNLPQTHFFRFLQIRNYIRTNTNTFPNLERHQMDSMFAVDPSSRGVISYIHDNISSRFDPSLEFLKTAWEGDLGISLTEELWSDAQSNVHTASVCARHGLIQFKVLHRLHYSKVKLSKMYPNTDPMCDRCKAFPATLGHMFWSCPKLSNYWNSIFKALSDVLGYSIDPDPVMAVLGVPGEDSPLRGRDCTIPMFVTLLARRLILLNWKQAQPPAFNMLINDVMQHLKLENLRFTLKGSTEKFFKTWQPFIDYVKARP